MAIFVQGVQFEVIHCASCSAPFGLNADFIQRRRNDHKTFYCPDGHHNAYNGKNEAARLRDELDQAKRQRDEANAKRIEVEGERDSISQAHKRMRKRITAGVCPCCNRSFDNLRRHMETQHSDFGTPETFAALRKAFGMTQLDVAREARTMAAYVSLYERGKQVPQAAERRLEWWLQLNEGKRA